MTPLHLERQWKMKKKRKSLRSKLKVKANYHFSNDLLKEKTLWIHQMNKVQKDQK